ncbi:MAG TPA: hypothetical protein VF943_04035 [Burkholderiales bacterium]
MIRILLAAALCAAWSAVHAHHGVAGVGAAGLEGPGAPIESATSAVLPVGSSLALIKLDHAEFRKFDSNPANPELDHSNFWIAGAGYGFTPWFTGYLFVPYHDKVDEPGGFSTRGFADVSVMGQVGFKYDKGFRLLPESESLDDLEDWHYTTFAGMSFPTGDPNLRDGTGAIDPSKSTGFGKPSYTLGFTATKLVSRNWTFNAELSHLRFTEYRYDDGNKTRFGPEYRANAAVMYRTYTNAESRMRLDLVMEAQYLYLGRDSTNGAGAVATGGTIYYLVPGVRLYWGRMSAAIGIKKPVSAHLHEDSLQQGAEGKERYRLITSVSVLF